jgi:hypothetical protein
VTVAEPGASDGGLVPAAGDGRGQGEVEEGEGCGGGGGGVA